MGDKFGNLLLETVFGGDTEPLMGEVMPPFHPAETPNLRRRHSNSPYKSPLEWLDYEDYEPDISSPSKSLEISHAIAWYLPFRYYGAKYWGIYFDKIAMHRLGKEIATSARRVLPEFSNSVGINLLYSYVFRHELEHAIQEIVMATAIDEGGVSRAQLNGLAISRPGSYRETLATQAEMLDFQEKTRVPAGQRRLFHHIYTSLPLHPPYSGWKNADSEVLARELDFDLNFGLFDESQTERFRSVIGRKAKSKYLDIPVFDWLGNSMNLPLTGSDLRAHSIDCKKLERLLRKDKYLAVLGEGLTTVPGSDHDILLRNPNTRPVKIDCHDWDQIPNHVIGQLAEATSLSRSELVERILRNI
jgi:hypothetical protein